MAYQSPYLDKLYAQKQSNVVSGDTDNTAAASNGVFKSDYLDNLYGMKKLEPEKPGILSRVSDLASKAWTIGRNKTADLFSTSSEGQDRIKRFRQQVIDNSLAEKERFDNAAPVLKHAVGLDRPRQNKGLEFVRNLNNDIVDIGVGFPAQLAGILAGLPAEVEEIKQRPKESAALIGREAVDSLKGMVDSKNYTPQAWYEHPGQNLANILMLSGATGAVGSRSIKGYRSLKKLTDVEMPTLTEGDLPNQATVATPGSSYRISGYSEGKIGDKVSNPLVRTYVPEPKKPAFPFSDKPYDPKSLEHERAPLSKNSLDNLTDLIIDPNRRLSEYSVKEETIPEAPQTLKLQLDALKQGRTKAVLVTPGETLPELPKTMKTLETDVGTFVYNPLRLRPQTIEESVSRGTHGELLGHAEPKSLAATETVAALQNGIEAKTSVVSPENVQKQVRTLKKQFPQSEIKVGGEELAADILKQREAKTADIAGLSEIDLIRSLFGDERGSISSKALSAEKQAYAQELLRRVSEQAKQAGETIENTLAPEQIRLLVQNQQGKQQQDYVTKITPAGHEIPVKVGSQTIPSSLVENASEWKDIKPYQGQTKDISRIVEKVTGKDAPEVENFLIRHREEAVTSLMNEVAGYKNEVKTNIVDKLGIKARSKESAAVQQFGEKRLSLEALQKKFPTKWQNIVEADKYFRAKYDQILNEVNSVLEVNGKDPIPRRDNYYTHIQELSSIWDTLRNPAAIDPQLAGVSEFVKPVTKFNPFAQRRKGGEFVDDAVQAFDRYLMPSLTQKHLTPVIARHRAFADALAAKTLESKNISNFISNLHDHANALAGKTNPMDRFLQDKVLGRKAMKVVDWVSHRLGANTIVGNFGSIVMQAGSLPQTLEAAGPFNVTKGLIGTLADQLRGGSEAMKKSPFLQRRYADVDALAKGIMQKAEGAVSLPLKIFEQYMVESSWRANYYKALEKVLRESEAIKIADKETMRQIGGRAIGEKPLVFQSRVGNLALMFQLEVNNFAQRAVQDIGIKDPVRLVKLFTYTHLFNLAYQSLMNRSPLPDPYQAVKEAATMESKDKKKPITVRQRLGRVAGEVISNLPGGQTAAAVIPQETRKKYFGRTEVGMYPGGIPVTGAITKGIKYPETFITSFVTPFGGNQISKSIRGYRAIKKVKGLSDTEKAKTLILGPAGMSEEHQQQYRKILKRERKKK